MILYTSYYQSPFPARQEELLYVLNHNIRDNHFKIIHLFLEETLTPPNFPKVIASNIVFHTGPQPTIQTYIDHANIHHKNEIIVIANLDIYFDESLSLLNDYDLTNKFLCLSRWDEQKYGDPVLFPYADSQDTWIFKAPLKQFNADFKQGVLGVDNRLAYEAKAAGLEVSNPCHSIKTIHKHTSQIRQRNHSKYEGGILPLYHTDLNGNMGPASAYKTNPKNDVILSYSLFTPKQFNPRPYDICERDIHRYWRNIPFLVAINKIVYRDFKIVIHCDPKIKEHLLYPLLDGLVKQQIIELDFCNHEYTNTQPTLWRLKNVFENPGTVLCRDIDSIPNTAEIKATSAFLRSKFLIQSMRTHAHHNRPTCRFLAGLCGFKHEAKMYVFGTFDEFYAKAGGHWGCDQDLLSSYFIDRLGPYFTKESILDTVIANNWPMTDDLYGAGKLPQSAYNEVDLSDIPPDILEMIDKLTTWVGEPVDVCGQLTKNLLDHSVFEVCYRIKALIEANSILKDFYGL